MIPIELVSTSIIRPADTRSLDVAVAVGDDRRREDLFELTDPRKALAARAAGTAPRPHRATPG
jgi:hypothetical protein